MNIFINGDIQLGLMKHTLKYNVVELLLFTVFSRIGATNCRWVDPIWVCDAKSICQTLCVLSQGNNVSSNCRLGSDVSAIFATLGHSNY